VKKYPIVVGSYKEGVTRDRRVASHIVTRFIVGSPDIVTRFIVDAVHSVGSTAVADQ
jgi:hypothetical protein